MAESRGQRSETEEVGVKSFLKRQSSPTSDQPSRCLKDPAARELRLLWQTALERDKVLGWKGSPHR
jgi:hypothetical protein